MENYEKIGKLGHGSFGRVWKARSKSTGETVAIKEIDYSRMGKKEKEMLVSEVNVLRKLSSPHIVTYKDRFVNREKHTIHIVMEYCPFGDLQTLITSTRGHRQSISEDQIWLTLADLISALCDCHNGEEKVLHRDIKPANIFIDGKGHVKLGDFGLAKEISTTDFAKTRVGTPYYMSPELVSGHPYNDKSDIWALGCVAYEMATLKTAFRGAIRSEEDLYYQIRNASVPRIPSMYSDALWEVILSMLDKDPLKRASAADIAKVPNIQLALKLAAAREELAKIREKTTRLRAKAKELDAREQKICSIERKKRDGHQKLHFREDDD